MKRTLEFEDTPRMRDNNAGLTIGRTIENDEGDQGSENRDDIFERDEEYRSPLPTYRPKDQKEAL